jgi:hypothetical protein
MNENEGRSPENEKIVPSFDELRQVASSCNPAKPPKKTKPREASKKPTLGNGVNQYTHSPYRVKHT